jgi:hypothetical protein
MNRANLRLMASIALGTAVILAWLSPGSAYAEYGPTRQVCAPLCFHTGSIVFALPAKLVTRIWE